MRGPWWREEVVVLISLAEFNEPRNTSPLGSQRRVCRRVFAFLRLKKSYVSVLFCQHRGEASACGNWKSFLFFFFFPLHLSMKKETFDFEAWIRENETRNNYARRVKVSYLRHFRNWSARIGFGVGRRVYCWFTPRYDKLYFYSYGKIRFVFSWNRNACWRHLDGKIFL